MSRWSSAAAIGGIVGLLFAGVWLLLGAGGGAKPADVPSDLPAHVVGFISRLSPPAREAYLYALERPDILQYIPCYCGCASSGHTSNLVCFVKSRASDTIELESHGST